MEVTVTLRQPHLNQQRILDEAKRFNHIKCGRRFGKTEMSIELAVNELLLGHRVAYFSPTYKDSYEWWKQIKHTCEFIIKSKDEKVLQLLTVTGGLLDVWSMEDPDSGRGRKYHRAIMDECEKASKFKQSWLGTIRATLTDYKGDAWFLSTPKFGKTFFKELALYKDKFPNWQGWTFTTFDNPHIDPEEIEDARRTMDNLYFRCEFLAEDVDLTGRPFAYAFDPIKHVRECHYTDAEELHISFDFNVDPITAIASQYVDGEIRVLKEFRLQNSDIYELCDQIVSWKPEALFIITGDATGHNRAALAQGNINYYSVIKQKLSLADGQMRQPSANPAVKDSRVLVNSLLQNHALIIDPSCIHLIEDLKYVEVKEDTNDIDKTKDKHRSHLLDTFRYLLNTFHKDLIHLKIFEEPTIEYYPVTE